MKPAAVGSSPRNRQDRVAAKPTLNLARHAARGSQRAEGVGQIVARGHVEHHEPAAQSRLELAPEAACATTLRGN